MSQIKNNILKIQTDQSSFCYEFYKSEINRENTILHCCCRLHFRPKTPPPDWEPPCDMLFCQDTFFDPCSANTPFSMEVQPLDPTNNSLLLDKSSFVTEPFGAMMEIPEVIGTTTSTAATATSLSGAMTSCSGTLTLPTGAVTLSSGTLTSSTGVVTSSSSNSQASSSQNPLVNTLILPPSVSFSSTYCYDTNSRDSTSSSDSNSDYRTIGCTTFRLINCGEGSKGTTSNNSRQYNQQQQSTQQNHHKTQQQQKRATGSGIILSSSLCGGTSAATNRKTSSSTGISSSFSNTSKITAGTTAAPENESVLAVRLGTARSRGGNNTDSTNTLGSTNGLLTQFDFDGKQIPAFLIL